MGIEVIDTPYGPIKIYNREKTICDMFRYRKKLGEDIALEALKNYITPVLIPSNSMELKTRPALIVFLLLLNAG